MDFGFTEEQNLLREQVRRFLDNRAPLAEVRKWMRSEQGHSPDLWREMADLGWVGLIVPESYGGVGLGFLDLTVVLEEMGRSLFPSPLISNTLTQSILLAAGSEDLKRRWLPSLADGTKCGAIAIVDESDCLDTAGVTLDGEPIDENLVLNGVKALVHDAPSADLLVVGFRAAGDIWLALIDVTRDGVKVTPVTGMDETKRAGRVSFDSVEIEPGDLLAEVPITDALLARLFDFGAIAVTAEAIGAAESALELTNAYAKERVQFGAPIGRYQGVKHRLAEMYVDIESIRSLLYYAAWTADESPQELARSTSLAKAYASDAFARIGIDGVQLHGAIGFTAEYDIQLYLKRSKWTRPVFGDSDFHYERVAELGEA